MLPRCRAITGAISRRISTAVAGIRNQVKTYGICGGQSGTVVGFLRVLLFPLQIFIPQTAPHSSSLSGAGTIGQLMADVPSVFSLTPRQLN
jgi:hypothetical protein